ncbi:MULTISPECIES: sulfatase [Parabacteroides]|uniref:sulfatase n=1 Tax=Parabacteroides TaxID=375288 RepID=UPI00257C2966|nr:MULTISPECIES: sulfatase [Parabacteroides]
MRHPLYKKALAFSCLLFPIALQAVPEKSESQSNVLFILVDDLGYGDLGCTGSKLYETPNIDRLAREGVTFSAAYAACPVSSPSRAAIITGKYPARINLTDYIPGNQAYGPHKDQQLESLPFKLHLELSETGIAEAFRRNGYTTFFAGKWHLGEKPEYYPEHFGFDENKGGNRTGHPAGGYFSPYKNPQLADGPEGEYLTDRLTDEVISYLHRVGDKPFFAYLSYYTVHLPLQAKPEKVAKYKKKLEQMQFPDPEFIKKGKIYQKQYQNISAYAAMVETLDDNVGRLMQTLKELGLDENTIVVFTSDNGGMATSRQTNNIPTSNLPLRAGKGYLYEGGIRVPLFVRWKGSANKVISCSEPVMGMDFYPTLLDLCELPLMPEQHKDGVSVKPLLLGEKMERGPVFWHYPHYSGGLGGHPSAAVRSGDYKLIEFFEDNHVELYNVVEDVSEQHDLSVSRLDITDRLRSELHVWYKKVNALMPVKNSYYVVDENDNI